LIATPVNEWLWKINDSNCYNEKTGLAHWLLNEELFGNSHKSEIGTAIA